MLFAHKYEVQQFSKLNVNFYFDITLFFAFLKISNFLKNLGHFDRLTTRGSATKFSNPGQNRVNRTKKDIGPAHKPINETCYENCLEFYY